MPFRFYIILIVALIILALYIYIENKVYDLLLRNRLSRVLGGKTQPLAGFVDVLLRVLGRPLAGIKERERLSAKLAKAGLAPAKTLNIFLIIKLSIVLIGALICIQWLNYTVDDIFGEPIKTLQLLFVIFIASRLPDWWLSGKIKERMARISASVPQALDFMTICVESGLSLEQSFDRVAREIEKLSPEVASEFRLTQTEMMVMDRFLALKRLERRSGVREMATMANSLLQSIQYGTPLSNALKHIAADCRATQIAALEEKAGSISARIGIPLVLLVLFPLVALIAAPSLISLMRVFTGM